MKLTPSTTSIISAAIAIIACNQDYLEGANLDTVLGSNKNEIIEEIQKLEGSDLSMIKESINILSKYELNITQKKLEAAIPINPQGLRYSTDPAAHPKA